jgi:uncharacterized membrane protein
MLKWISHGWRRIVAYFVAGLLAILPLVLTAAIVVWVTTFLTDYLGPTTFIGRTLAALGLKFGSDGILAYATGWIAVLAALFGLGLLVELGAKRLYHQLLDRLFRRVPVIGSLYGSLKQLVGMFERKEETDLKAMSVVFCYFGSRQGPGVLALMPSPEPVPIDGQDYHVVIIPTAPIPFGGGLLFVPVDQVKPVAMSVDNFISIYVSMGVTTPEFMGRQAKSLENSPATGLAADE